jgi:hypothetical protein
MGSLRDPSSTTSSYGSIPTTKRQNDDHVVRKEKKRANKQTNEQTNTLIHKYITP